MSDEYIETVSDRYIELYENITGDTFEKGDISDIQGRIEANVLAYLEK
jgi:phosphoribosylaminoimidazole-succinocarboxamide synthase